MASRWGGLGRSRLLLPLLSFLVLAAGTSAQFPPPISADDVDIKTAPSPANENITIRYKSPLPGTCQTAFSSQKQYTGYVSLPPSTLAPIQQKYPINTFFWFVEARESPESAPLTIYLNGGPGSTSLIGLFQEVGPCEVVEIDQSRLGTRARAWGWDRSSNLLFIDQPNQVGLSYDTLTNGSFNLVNAQYEMPPASVPSGQPGFTFLNGTFSSNLGSHTTNTSAISAQAAWHILQAFLSEFPQYKPGGGNSSVGINLFAESYGGHYGPAFAAYFEEQNDLLDKGQLAAAKVSKIDLVSLGIVQGCVDDLIQGPFYAEFAYNNSYGIQAVTQSLYEEMVSSFSESNGCQDQIQACRKAVAANDPDNMADNSGTNTACASAVMYCNQFVIDPYQSVDRSPYDISQSQLDPFPSNLYLEYLNDAAVQASIGAPVNFTMTSQTVASVFEQTGDRARGGQVAQLASLLAKGVRVALVHGDRDYLCNWRGGEAVSFSVASAATGYLSSFNSAGYAPIITNGTYIGGVVRQAGNLSFSRIYDAGHEIAAYQPETMFTLFSRIIQGTDLSSGQPADLATFQSNGDANSTATNSAPPMASPTCFLRSISDTCDQNQQSMLGSGSGVIINGVLYESESQWSAASSDMESGDGDPLLGDAGVPGATSVAMTPALSQTSSVPATGVFTATKTPRMANQRSVSAGVSSTALAGRGGWTVLVGSVPLVVAGIF